MYDFEDMINYSESYKNKTSEKMTVGQLLGTLYDPLCHDRMLRISRPHETEKNWTCVDIYNGMMRFLMETDDERYTYLLDLPVKMWYFPNNGNESFCPFIIRVE